MGSAALEGFIDTHFIVADSMLGNYSGPQHLTAPISKPDILDVTPDFSVRARIDLEAFVQPEQP